ncbi:hypothetical protein DL95DRAFT_271743, partial [Leptodontidium sp. 2 PMI_412]
VRITRSLGIRYLWIDCLCIIEDDPQDWEQQAAAISSVYRHAYLTISASASLDSTSGCFPPLSTRGWTLQERVLSPRTVHYASDQLYFECESEVW